MFCCPIQSIPPPTEKAQSYVSTLRILMLLQLLLGIMKFFTASFFSGFSDLISCMIIYQGYAQLSSCNILFAIFINGISFIQTLAMVGAVIQDGYPAFNSIIFSNDAYTAVMNYISLFFYIILLTACFYAYREFKAISFEYGGVGAGGMGGQAAGGSGGSYLPQQNPPGGSGGSVGSVQNYRPPNPAQASTNAGGFNAFGGRGVTIG